jgi:hypothetical protein
VAVALGSLTSSSLAPLTLARDEPAQHSMIIDTDSTRKGTAYLIPGMWLSSEVK